MENNLEITETKPLRLQKTMTRARKYEFHLNDTEKNKKEFKHKDNRIDTTRYNLFTFLPKALLFQFFRLANIYFLFIAIIQSIDVISPLGKETAWAPLAFVLCVSLIREAIEDLSRYRYDKILNSESVTVFRNGEWTEAASGGLQIGEIILVHEDSPLPADMILLDSNMKEGISFIETGTLDGEKTLKQKLAQKETAGVFNKDDKWKVKFDVSGFVICDSPNPELYKLDGSMEFNFDDFNGTTKSVKVPVEAKQLLLKGALLRNTKWVVGFVAYTGHNNKLILNSKNPRMKYSTIEKLMSRLLIVILLMQVSFCVVCAAINTVYYKSNVEDNPYLPKYIYGNIVDPLLSYFTYTLLLNTMIPISLIISLEIAKLIQGYFISVDVEGYSHVRQKFIKAASVSLNEELGQVNFIFSDKTGTLTCNKMEFKYGVLGDVCYEYVRKPRVDANGNSNLDEKKKLNEEEEDIMKFGPGRFSPNNFRGEGESKYPGFKVVSDLNPNTYLNLESESSIVSEYWKALSVCHQCEIEEKENGTLEYTGLSPDDIELVKTAASQGYDLKKSPSTSIRRVEIGGTVQEFELLQILEFDSTRKRMSVIVRDGNLIKLYLKGADTAVEWIGRVEDGKTRLSPNSRKDFLAQAKRYVDYFSTKGYRTLLMGVKVLDENEYNDFSEKLKEANLSLENKQEAIEEVYATVEKNIYLLGATIVEDKLQDQVPETIRDLRLAGIKVWMLTGDKMDTAYNIGLSCNLLSKDIKLFKLHGEKGDRLTKLVQEYKHFQAVHSSSRNLPAFSILIDAVALSLIIENKESTKFFLDISYSAASVICCRVSPLQKSEVVRIMKEYDSKAVTLAIGDGGNDVSMIMEAHIGIGLYGEEGMRAVQSGDYALGEFKILRRLLLFHGRSNNIRVSKMILYFFYKNFVFTITHFYYAFYNNCSGQTIIDDWFITFYNMIFTAFPLGVMSIVDFDVKPEDGEIIDRLLPFLYKENREQPVFTKLTFLLELFRGIVHGIINFMFLVYTLGIDNTDGNGNYADLWFFSVACFTNIIFIVSVRIIIIIRFHTYMNWLIMAVLSWLLYILFVIIVNFGSTYKSYATMYVAFSGGKFYFDFMLIVGTCAMIDMLTCSIDILFTDKTAYKLLTLVKEKGSLNTRIDLPDSIVKLLEISDRANNQEHELEPSNTNKIKIDQRKANEDDLELKDRVVLNDNSSERNRKKLNLGTDNDYINN